VVCGSLYNRGMGGHIPTPKANNFHSFCYSSENEGAKFWLSVLTDLKQRGVEDILIACIDGLRGLQLGVSSYDVNVPENKGYR